MTAPLFWTVPDAERETGVDRYRIDQAVKAAGVTPVFTKKNGRGLMRFFDADVLRKLVDKLKRDEKAKAEQAAAIQAAAQTKAPQQPPSADLSPVNKALGELGEQIDALSEQVKNLSSQNAVLLRTMERLSSESEARITRMLNQMANGISQVSGQITTLPVREAVAKSVDAPPAPKVVLTEASHPVAVPPRAERTAMAEALSKALPAAKPRVLIVGVLPSQTADIMREFGTDMDLRFVALTEMRLGRQLPGLSAADAVVVTMKTAHRFANDLKIDNLVKVTGGTTSLKAALTELYVKLTDKQKEAA